MKKKRRWILPVIIIVVVLVGGFVLSRALKPSAVNANAQQYEAVKVTKGDIQVTVHGTGSIEVMDAKTVSAGANSKVDTLLVENGDAVKQGQVLATLNADSVNDQITSLKQQIVTQDATIAGMRAMPGTKYLYAPVDARVKAIYAKLDDDVNVSMSSNNALMVLSTDGKMKVEFVPENGTAVNAGSAVTLVINGDKVNGFITTVPDSTTDKAVAVISDDSYDIGAKAVIDNAAGTEVGQGELEVNTPLLVTADSGTVDHFYVKVNDKVRRNHKLVRLTGYILNSNFEAQLVLRQQLQDNLSTQYDDLKDYTITAPADGIVTDLAIQQGGAAQDGMPVCTIQETTGFKLVVAVDELDIPGIKLGQKADVKIDALPNQTASGVVSKISPIGDISNDVTTYNVTLTVTAPAGALANMSASADIEVAFKAATLLVPVEAIHTVNGKTYVYGALPYDQQPTDSTAATSSPTGPFGGRMSGFFGRKNASANDAKLQRPMIEVTVGLVSDSSAEILSGLSEGTSIAVPVAQSGSSTSAMFGGMGGSNGKNANSQSQPSATTSES